MASARACSSVEEYVQNVGLTLAGRKPADAETPADAERKALQLASMELTSECYWRGLALRPKTADVPSDLLAKDRRVIELATAMEKHDFPKALEVATVLADLCFPYAMTTAGIINCCGPAIHAAVAGNYEQGLRQLAAAAAVGDPAACDWLALHYQTSGNRDDEKKAATFRRKARRLGWPH